MARKKSNRRKGKQYYFQYAVKLLCTAHIPGTSQTSKSLLPGMYQTAVNIHNPNTETIQFRVKLVVAEPSKFVKDRLKPNHATTWDCDRVSVAFGPFIHGVEGFLVIESTHSLDVTAVYTAGYVGGQVESIDVEQIHERRITIEPTGRPEMDHFNVYEVEAVEADFQVRLTDQLAPDPKEAQLETLAYFANPTRKMHGEAVVGVTDADRHFNWYAIYQEKPEPQRTIRFLNQFGQHSVNVGDPKFLLVPAQKTSDEISEFPEFLDHYKCYEVVEVNAAPAPPVVLLGDQFDREQEATVGEPRFFCLPVMKEWEGTDPKDIINAEDHLAVYDISPETHRLDIRSLDQFGEHSLQVLRRVMLAVPSEKQEVVTHEG